MVILSKLTNPRASRAGVSNLKKEVKIQKDTKLKNWEKEPFFQIT